MRHGWEHRRSFNRLCFVRLFCVGFARDRSSDYYLFFPLVPATDAVEVVSHGGGDTALGPQRSMMGEY